MCCIIRLTVAKRQWRYVATWRSRTVVEGDKDKVTGGVTVSGCVGVGGNDDCRLEKWKGWGGWMRYLFVDCVYEGVVGLVIGVVVVNVVVDVVVVVASSM